MAASTCIDARLAQVATLDVENLALARGERLLFDARSFSVASGQALIIEGPNGAGKTSLLRAIAGFLEPQAGAIRVRTTSGTVIEDAAERATLIGWLGHQDGLKSQATPAEVLQFYARYYGAAEALGGALETVGLARVRDLPILYLSAGQKRRLALTRLSLSARPIWLLDEPFASLDASGKQLATDLIAAHRAAGGIVLAATHEPLGFEGTRFVLSGASQ